MDKKATFFVGSTGRCSLFKSKSIRELVRQNIKSGRAETLYYTYIFCARDIFGASSNNKLRLNYDKERKGGWQQTPHFFEAVSLYSFPLFFAMDSSNVELYIYFFIFAYIFQQKKLWREKEQLVFVLFFFRWLLLCFIV